MLLLVDLESRHALPARGGSNGLRTTGKGERPLEAVGRLAEHALGPGRLILRKNWAHARDGSRRYQLNVHLCDGRQSHRNDRVALTGLQLDGSFELLASLTHRHGGSAHGARTRRFGGRQLIEDRLNRCSG